VKEYKDWDGLAVVTRANRQSLRGRKSFFPEPETLEVGHEKVGRGDK